MKYATPSLLAILTYALSQFASAQSTISVNVSSAPNCTSPTSCGPTTLQANGFAANGNGAGGLNIASGSAPSQPGVGIPANTISFYAPQSVSTPYGIALYPSTSSAPTGGFWLAVPPTTAATFATVNLSSGAVSGFSTSTGVASGGGGAGYVTAPPCYFSPAIGSPPITTQASCYFTVSGGQITAVNIPTGGSGAGYTTGYAPSITAAPTLFSSYVPSMYSGTSSYKVQATTGTPAGGDLPVFNSSGTGDLVDSNIPIGGTFAVTAGNYLRATGAYFTSSGIVASDVPNPLNQNTTGTAANLSGTPTLPNGTAAATQSATDSTTKLATDAYVQNVFAAPPSLGSTTAAPGSLTTLTATQINQGSCGSGVCFAGSCSMATSHSSCTFTVSASFTSGYVSFVSIDQATMTLTAQVAKCSVSGTTATITASSANNMTWDCLLVGNPH